MSELEKMITNLQLMVENKDTEINSLKSNLKDLKFSMELLSMENTEKQNLLPCKRVKS